MFRKLIGTAPVQLSIDQIVDPFVVDRADMIRIVQQFRQIISHSYNGGAFIPFLGISEGFLGMGMIDQNLRAIAFCIDLHIFTEKYFRVQLFRVYCGTSVHSIKISNEIIKIL